LGAHGVGLSLVPGRLQPGDTFLQVAEIGAYYDLAYRILGPKSSRKPRLPGN
jgi:hypothetical protein